MAPKTIRSKDSAVEKNRRAVVYEEQLKSSTDHNQKNEKRGPLCEVLSDLVLEHTSFAIEYDVMNRLWKNCFYERISLVRSRIHKLKAKHLDTKQAEKSLHFLLQEAHALYDFLIKALFEKLENISSHSAEASSRSYIVALAQLHIYVGDLFRYHGDKQQKAETAYRISSQLAAGYNGHSYNQLAVICQANGNNSKTVVALYWYTRAILTTYDTSNFQQTAQNNLSLLFKVNRDFLKKTEEATVVAVPDNQLFLARFCDLQYAFFSFLEQNSDSQLILSKINETVHQFSILLNKSTFSDGLLCKIVTILAFSECFRSSHKGEPQHQQPQLATASVLGRIMMYEYGTILADRLARVLQSKRLKSSSRQPVQLVPSMSVRGLMPYLLLTEYCVHRNPPTINVESSVLESYKIVKNEFWKLFVTIFNEFSASIRLHSERELFSSNNSPMDLKEYKLVKGFAPFSDFISTPPDGLASAKDAIQILQEGYKRLEVNVAEDESAVTGTTSSSSSSSSIAFENKLKIGRFLQLGELLLQNEHISEYVHRVSEDSLVWKDHDDESMQESDNGVAMDTVETDENNVEREAVSEVKYIESSTGHRLLVLQDLEEPREEQPLSPKTDPTNMNSKASVTGSVSCSMNAGAAVDASVSSSMTTEKVQHVGREATSSASVQASFLSGPSTSMPLEHPAGNVPIGLNPSFGEPIAPQMLSSEVNSSIIPQLAPPPGLPPPPGYSGTVMSNLPVPQPTLNPFTSLTYQNGTDWMFGSYGAPHSATEDVGTGAGMEDTSLLLSNVLNSLFDSPSKTTENPFA